MIEETSTEEDPSPTLPLTLMLTLLRPVEISLLEFMLLINCVIASDTSLIRVSKIESALTSLPTTCPTIVPSSLKALFLAIIAFFTSSNLARSFSRLCNSTEVSMGVPESIEVCVRDKSALASASCVLKLANSSSTSARVLL